MSDVNTDTDNGDTSENTATTQVRKISHVKFTLPKPYGEGHTCSAEEAEALNDAFARRVSQQVSADISDVSIRVEATADAEARIDWVDNWSQERAQKEIIDAYVSQFSWTKDRSRDPVETEIFRLARVAVEDAMDKQGVVLDRAAKNRKVREVVDANYAKLKKIAEKNINTPLVAVNLAA